MKALVCMLLLTACGDAATPDHDTIDADTADTAEVTPGTLTFHATPSSGEAVVVRQASLSADELVLEVATSGLQADDQVFAIGARLTYDPDVLSFIDATPGEAWDGAVTDASAARPGTLVLAVAHPHAFFEEPGPPLGDEVLYRLRFAITRVAATPLTLVASRSRALVWPGPSSDPQRRLSISFVGGALTLD